jgi:hypothetical protein
VGTSNWQNISHCVGTLRRLMPQSVLDVGTGFGRWGMLCREFLDAWEGREARALWQVRIEGIEAFPSCLTPLHGYIYDRIHVGDAVDLLPTLGVYDVVYMGDVVEHQTKARAWQLMEAAVRHARQAVIVTIPIGDNWPQEVGADGNWFHAHRSRWHLEDFDAYPDAPRQAFSDYHGRMYLVIELPGTAGATHVSSAAIAAAPVPIADPGRGETRHPVMRIDAPACDGLLDRVDENLTCRGLVDDTRVSGEVAGTLLFQLPAAADIRRRLEQLEAERIPWVGPFGAMVDALFRHLVGWEASRSPAEAGHAPAPDTVVVVERLSAALASLADHAQGYTEVASMLRDMRMQLDTLTTVGSPPTPQRTAVASARSSGVNPRAAVVGPHH